MRLASKDGTQTVTADSAGEVNRWKQVGYREVAESVESWDGQFAPEAEPESAAEPEPSPKSTHRRHESKDADVEHTEA